MRAWPLALVVAAGCGRIAFDGNADATVDSPADAWPDAAPRVCPPSVMNDEDGDGVDDNCDVCPHLSGTQLDSDGDGVGDDCDADPAAQRIVFFDSFTTDRPEWVSTAPVVGGQMIVDVANGDFGAQLNYRGTRFRLLLGGEILEVGPVPQQLFISALPSATESYYVEVIDTGSGRRRSLMHALGSTMYTELDGYTEAATAIPTGRLVIEIAVDADKLNAVLGLGSSTTYMGENGTPSVDSLYSLLYAKNLSVVFDYALVIETL